MSMAIILILLTPANSQSNRDSSILTSELSLPDHGRCEPITVQMCKDLRYNQTIMPNLLNHQNQEEAGNFANHFMPLVRVKCSPDIHLFLCSVYIPVCTVLDKAIPPCRSLCESARSQTCLDIMGRFGFSWPEQLDCKRFPEASTQPLCVGMDTSDTVAPSLPSSKSATNVSRNLGFKCPLQFKTPAGLDYRLRIRGEDHENCGVPCDDVFFPTKQDPDERRTLRIWIGIWSGICVASTAFTMFTFLIDRHRFKYPQRPVIYLSLCYLGIGLVYFVGSFMGDSASCNRPFPLQTGSTSFNNLEMVSTVTQGNKRQGCTFLFMTLYFCSMASCVWWVILTFCWFLAAGKAQLSEVIESNSHYFHLLGWALPALMTITVLALGKIEGDVLSGVCYVGNWNQEAMYSFVMIPTAISLALGLGLLVFSFIYVWQLKTAMKKGGAKTDRFDKLLLRIGFFAFLYITPTGVLLCAYHYGSASLDTWILSWLQTACKNRDFGIPCPLIRPGDPAPSRPHFVAFLVKYLMIFLPGIMSGFWVSSEKTLQSWAHFSNRIYKFGSCLYYDNTRDPDSI